MLEETSDTDQNDGVHQKPDTSRYATFFNRMDERYDS